MGAAEGIQLIPKLRLSPMRSADGTGAIPTILIGTLVCPTIGAGDPVPAGARAANIIMEQAPVAESLRLPLATQGGEPWALKKPPTHLRWRVMAPRSQSSSAISSPA